MSRFRLIVAEKPSVARDIAATLGARGKGQGFIGRGDLRVTWCVGHLVELAEPVEYDRRWRSWRLEYLPMLPEEFGLKPRQGARDQWEIVSGLLRDHELEDVVNACDAGREGELIFAYVYQLSKCRAPVRRLWISSMTQTAIKQGFAGLRPGGEMKRLEDAARCRSEADWLVGLNATRAMTLRVREGSSSVLLSLGRVQTPTLGLLEEREKAIESFVPEAFWQVKVRFAREEGTTDPQNDVSAQWEATWTEVQGDKSRVDRLEEEAKAREVLARIAGLDGIVTKVERKKKREYPPLLYDLTTLQREANKRFRFSAKHTLDLAQALYETHKVVTYPRTDSRHLSSDQVAELPKVIEGLRFGPYQETAEGVLSNWTGKPGKRVVDDSEVSDHHAIIPTGVDPRRVSLSVDEKKVFDLIARRFLAVFMTDAVFATAVVETHIGDDMFFGRGRTMLDPGWRAVDPPVSSKEKKKEVTLPPVEKGERALHIGNRLHEGVTKPPKRFTEATLLGAMERAGEALDEAELKRAMKRNGLGTPATRAAVIETLISRGYIERKKGSLLHPTLLGRALLRALPVEALRSPRLTGEWEARLSAMSEGSGSREEFMRDIRGFTEELVEQIATVEISSAVRDSVAEATPRRDEQDDGEVLGPCSRCDGEVRAWRRGWRCSKCSLQIPDTVARRKVSPRMASQLLEKGVTPSVKGFRNREGKPFQAALKLDEKGGVAFFFPQEAPLGKCPVCGEAVRVRGSVYTCDTGRECPFLIPRRLAGKELDDELVKTLLDQGRTKRIHGFKSKSGSVFKAALMLDEKHELKLDYSKRAEDREVPQPGSPPPAFGRRTDCPLCVKNEVDEPGYLIAGREAWGCSRWREGCGFRIPFTIFDLRLTDEQGLRLARKRATRYLEEPIGPAGKRKICRVVLTLDGSPYWALEPKRPPRRSRSNR